MVWMIIVRMMCHEVWSYCRCWLSLVVAVFIIVHLFVIYHSWWSRMFISSYYDTLIDSYDGCSFVVAAIANISVLSRMFVLYDVIFGIGLGIITTIIIRIGRCCCFRRCIKYRLIHRPMPTNFVIRGHFFSIIIVIFYF